MKLAQLFQWNFCNENAAVLCKNTETHCHLEPPIRTQIPSSVFSCVCTSARWSRTEPVLPQTSIRYSLSESTHDPPQVSCSLWFERVTTPPAPLITQPIRDHLLGAVIFCTALMMLSYFLLALLDSWGNHTWHVALVAAPFFYCLIILLLKSYCLGMCVRVCVCM